jgi:hypothetical protein
MSRSEPSTSRGLRLAKCVGNDCIVDGDWFQCARNRLGRPDRAPACDVARDPLADGKAQGIDRVARCARRWNGIAAAEVTAAQVTGGGRMNTSCGPRLFSCCSGEVKRKLVSCAVTSGHW